MKAWCPNGLAATAVQVVPAEYPFPCGWRLERVADRNDDLMRKNAWQMDIKDRKVIWGTGTIPGDF